MNFSQGTTLNDEFEENDVEIEVEVTQWDYIKENLDMVHMNENDLIDLFGITVAALEHWKKGKRNISLDKIAVLCQLFGITIDEFFEKGFSEENFYERFFGLYKVKGLDDYKKISNFELEWLFERLKEASYGITYFSYADAPIEKDYPYPPKEIEYYCQTLDIDVTYDLRNQEKKTISSITYKELCDVTEWLKKDWGDEAPDHISVQPSKKYQEVLLLSEKYEYLIQYIKENNEKNELLQLWEELKSREKSYDKKCMMARVLLSAGAVFYNGNEVDMDKTMQLCKKIFKIDTSKEEE